jgi:hypothetical protein
MGYKLIGYKEPDPAKGGHEPVAWLEEVFNDDNKSLGYLAHEQPFENTTPVYLAPPKRDSSSWVGLTDADKEVLLANLYESVEGLITAIEAKLKDKNGW